MMEDIHPHWQADDNIVNLVPGPVEPQKPWPETTAVPAKRHTAALLGIALMLAAGFYFFGGSDLLPNFSAQVTGSSSSKASSLSSKSASTVTVHITNTGVEPATLLPGQSLTWQNDSSLPHIFASDTIKDEKGEPLYTSAIFPGTSLTVSFAPGQLAGSYTYVSRTASDVHGEITLAAATSSGFRSSTSTILGGTDDFSLFNDSSQGNTSVVSRASSASSVTAQYSSSDFAPAGFTSSVDANGKTVYVAVKSSVSSVTSSSTKSSQSSSKTAAVSSSPLLAGFSLPKGNDGSATDGNSSIASGVIPTNPYAVGSDRDHPYDQFGTRTGDPLHSGAPLNQGPKPLSQPATGGDLWLVILLSLITIGVGSSWMMRRQRA